MPEISKQYPRLVPLLKFIFCGLPKEFSSEYCASILTNPTKIQNDKASVQKLQDGVGKAITLINAMISLEDLRPGRSYKYKPELYVFIHSLSYAHDELVVMLEQAAREHKLKPMADRLKSGAELDGMVKSVYGWTPTLGRWKDALSQRYKACYPASGEPDLYLLNKHTRNADQEIAKLPVSAQPIAPVDPTWAQAQLYDYSTRGLTNLFGLFKTKEHRLKANELGEQLEKGQLTAEQLVAREQEYLGGATSGGFFDAFQVIKKKVEENQQAAAAPKI